jgi:hypothetical protein
MTATQGRREYAWQIVVRSITSHRRENIWAVLFPSLEEAATYAQAEFAPGAVLRIERVDVTPRKEQA